MKNILPGIIDVFGYESPFAYCFQQFYQWLIVFSLDN